jgi:hypothetical protein
MRKEDPSRFVEAAIKLIPKEFQLSEETSHTFETVWQMIADQGKKADAEREGE